VVLSKKGTRLVSEQIELLAGRDSRIKRGARNLMFLALPKQNLSLQGTMRE
jgi:hypothetical protein